MTLKQRQIALNAAAKRYNHELHLHLCADDRRNGDGQGLLSAISELNSLLGPLTNQQRLVYAIDYIEKIRIVRDGVARVVFKEGIYTNDRYYFTFHGHWIRGQNLEMAEKRYAEIVAERLTQS